MAVSEVMAWLQAAYKTSMLRNLANVHDRWGMSGSVGPLNVKWPVRVRPRLK
jgi:hypothetical protein